LPYEHHNPKINDVLKIIKIYLPLMHKEQLIILRSTVFPGTTENIDEMLEEEFGSAKLVFCPERIVQGQGHLTISYKCNIRIKKIGKV
jgi:UDP-N-acetyl-D-mannosaminuronic acid dehydrogenase